MFPKQTTNDKISSIDEVEYRGAALKYIEINVTSARRVFFTFKV